MPTNRRCFPPVADPESPFRRVLGQLGLPEQPISVVISRTVETGGTDHI